MKKWIVGFTGLAVAVLLAGCSNSTVASMKGAKITKDEYYDQMKKSSAGQQVLSSMIVAKALDQQYGKKVSKSKVTKQFNAMKAQYGSSFASTLAQNGYTESSFKDQIRTSLLSEVALKDLKKVSQSDLKKQYKSYQPKVKVQHILVKTKAQAQKIIDEFAKLPKNQQTTAEFGKLAKANSTDTGTKNSKGQLPAFDNTDTQLDATFKKAAFKLSKSGDYTTTPVKTQYGYHVIRMIDNPGKGKISDPATKKALTKQIYTTWESDSTVMNSITGKVLKKANVQIKDSDLKNVLSTYLNPSSSSSSAATTTGN
ncbi:peptidylprolyl isomerase [Lacticaseibacillus zhaodongensis]|uniref:peptidylprolyl isomerase n=1 Tax=Lacticaseibacillus zhaodongensis TaxID=2668065 RepID=UPI0012D34BD5|nr:peptidylprolyl isomerase [Lacticaseibacillus zhaodongensis]